MRFLFNLIISALICFATIFVAYRFRIRASATTRKWIIIIMLVMILIGNAVLVATSGITWRTVVPNLPLLVGVAILLKDRWRKRK